MALFTSKEDMENRIHIGTVDIDIDEEVDELEKTDVGVTVKSDVPCYVRARVEIPTLIDPVTREPVTPEVSELNEGWQLKEDGYYYYSEPVSASENGTTLVLFDSISYSGSSKLSELDPDKLSITVYAESLQSGGLPDSVTDAQSAFAYIGGTGDL